VMQSTICSLAGGWPELLPWQMQPFITKLSYQCLIDSFKGGFSPKFLWKLHGTVVTNFDL
jgi:hypothetical protein